MSDEGGGTHEGGPILEGTGPAWAPAPDPVPGTPKWVNGRAFPAVWRETLAFIAGAVQATVEQFPRMRPGSSWDHRPEPNSAVDVDQAIAAKIHLGLRILPLLATAQVVLVDPDLAELIPHCGSDDEEGLYAAEAKLPTTPLFLDLEGVDGLPVAWEAETWPFPFHLRAALCWTRDEMLCVVPFGSVGGKHPWGGSDYHAWARWNYLQGHSTHWPDPGPGDFIARPNGEVLAWIDADEDSICAHHGAVAYNLARRVLSVLMVMEALGGSLAEPSLQRSLRRRAQREGQKVALVPERFPQLQRSSPTCHVNDSARTEGVQCVVPQTHARLEQAHSLWHEALDAYAEPDEFVTKLNALIQALRTVTFVLRKEFGNSDEFNVWYEPWEALMKSDDRMRWAVSARNRIEKQGDLDTHSIARVRVRGDWLPAPVIDLEADPTADSREIARRVMVVGLPERVRKEGTLEVERRWTVAELAGDELLDVLAHCYAVLTRVVAAAHEQRGAHLGRCAVSLDQPCGAGGYTPHPSGRLPCMLASREARTSRRDLATGVPYEIELRPVSRDDFDNEEARRRYSLDRLTPPSNDAELLDRARALHEIGKQILVADGYHVPIAWLLRDGALVAQHALHPEDQRDKYMMMQRLATEADRLGTDEIIFTAEAWEAPAVEPDDPRAELRPGEREDRAEVFVTYAMSKDGPCHVSITRFEHLEAGVSLDETEAEVVSPPNFLSPLIQVWGQWRGC